MIKLIFRKRFPEESQTEYRRAREKARRQNPEYKAREKARRQIYQQTPEYKAHRKIYTKAYEKTLRAKALHAIRRKKRNQSLKGKNVRKIYDLSVKGRQHKARLNLRKLCRLIGWSHIIESGADVKYELKIIRKYLLKHPEKMGCRVNGVPDCHDIEIKVAGDFFSYNQILFALQRELPGGAGPLKVLWFPNKQAQEDWHLKSGKGTLFPTILDFWLDEHGQNYWPTNRLTKGEVI